MVCHTLLGQCLCNFMDEWASVGAVLTRQSLFLEADSFPLLISFVPFVNISFVVRLTCCYSQKKKTI